ncbi:hypothetical protein GobsT_30800 [Gemmata obscuriglobus]|uniref:HNH endonuclease n=1 Tax=Gemmata obscuriglobus TaxID=114 RepID=A0A2Z3H4W4_9BACT|nr:HNH endonuclease [Gemmata obscuriglobus]AWM38727.1 HNH endonuclease [Gemmata obscuriglobus]QEG28303.1 hypothetical protein GobsT_30800 [Gemmata obscuriglobus]VTS06141.1 hypothetical protein : : HNH [Gemmata obscuriglobus UQM 2246]
MPCFWCDRFGVRLTRDHVKPRCAGGGDEDNIVMACDGCQASRNQIQQYYTNAKVLRFKVAIRWPDAGRRHKEQIRRMRATLLKQLSGVLTLVAFWTQRETDRWGSSPTAALDLTVPDLPKRRA